jgi:hypothetical protein
MRADFGAGCHDGLTPEWQEEFRRWGGKYRVCRRNRGFLSRGSLPTPSKGSGPKPLHPLYVCRRVPRTDGHPGQGLSSLPGATAGGTIDAVGAARG